MSRKFLLWAMALVVILPALAGTGYWLYWDRFIRYAPVTIEGAENQLAIQTLLDQGDYLSPGKKDKFVYLVTYRSCKACRDYETREIPKLMAAGVEPRIIVYTLPDDKGIHRSTPEERSTVAELWLTRNWAFYQAWQSATDATWTAEGLTSADNDWARRSVVLGAQDYVNQLSNQLRNSKVAVSFPLVIWRDKNNQLKVCSCANDQSYHFIREDLGVTDSILDTDALMDRAASLFGGKSVSASSAMPVQAPQSAPASSSSSADDLTVHY